MSLRSFGLKLFLEGKLPDFLYRFIGRRLAKKVNLIDDSKEKLMENKPWYKSKTIISDIVTILIALYTTIGATLAPHLGWTLPAIPEWVFIVLGSIGIYGRVNADTSIAK